MFFGASVSSCGTRLSRSFANDSRVLFKWSDSPVSDSEILAEWTYSAADGLPASDARASVISGHFGPRKIKRGACIFQNDQVTAPFAVVAREQRHSGARRAYIDSQRRLI